jgi:prefoldin subunit 5
MVDELIVLCLEHERGCNWKGERQHFETHKRECVYHAKECKFGCGHSSTDINQHYKDCECRIVTCETCQVNFAFNTLEEHRKKCSPVKCSYCDLPITNLEQHYLSCSQFPAACAHHTFGCTWQGAQSLLESHLQSCTYESIKPFLHSHANTMRELREENSDLRNQVQYLQQTIFDISRNLLSILPGVPMSDGGYIPGALVPLGNEVQILKDNVYMMNMKLLEVETKLDQKLVTEYQRMKDEVQSLRSVCQTVQLQLVNMAFQNGTNNINPRRSGNMATNNTNTNQNIIGKPSNTKL